RQVPSVHEHLVRERWVQPGLAGLRRLPCRKRARGRVVEAPATSSTPVVELVWAGTSIRPTASMIGRTTDTLGLRGNMKGSSASRAAPPAANGTRWSAPV